MFTERNVLTYANVIREVYKLFYKVGIRAQVGLNPLEALLSPLLQEPLIKCVPEIVSSVGISGELVNICFLPKFELEKMYPATAHSWQKKGSCDRYHEGFAAISVESPAKNSPNKGLPAIMKE